MNLDKFEKKIHGIIEKNEEEIAEVKRQREANEEKIKNAKINLVQAKKDNNYELFHQAKKELWETENIQEYLQGRLELLEGIPLTSDEYFEIEPTLSKLTQEELDKVTEKATPIIEEINKLLREEQEIMLRAYRLSNLVESKIAKNAAVYNKRGTSISIGKVTEQGTYKAFRECLEGIFN